MFLGVFLLGFLMEAEAFPRPGCEKGHSEQLFFHTSLGMLAFCGRLSPRVVVVVVARWWREPRRARAA